MKSLLLILLSMNIFSANAFGAQVREPMGGVITTSSKRIQLGIECTKYKGNKCVEFLLLRKTDYKPFDDAWYPKGAQMDKRRIKVLIKDMTKLLKTYVRGGFGVAYYAPTGYAILGGMWPLAFLTVPVDIAKAPLIAVAQGLSEIVMLFSTPLKNKRLIKFLTTKKNKGKVKSVSYDRLSSLESKVPTKKWGKKCYQEGGKRVCISY